MTHVLVPILAAENKGNFEQDAWGFFILVTSLFGLAAIFLALTSNYWVSLIVPGFSDYAKSLTSQLTRIQLIGMVCTAGVSVLWSAFHARKRFIWVEVSPVFANLVALVVLIWALPKFGVSAAAWCTVLSAALQIVLLLSGLGPVRKPNWKSLALLEARNRIKPLILGTVYYKTDPLIDRFLASMAPAGGLSLLYIAQQVFAAANQVINKAIAAPMVPVLANHAVEGNWNVFQRLYRRRLGWAVLVTGTGYLMVLFAGEPALHLLIGYGGVTEQNVQMLWWILVMLIGVLIGGAVGQVLSTAFYAKGDTKTPTRIGIAGFTIGIVLKIFGYLHSGILGIAVGTTLYYLLNAYLLHRSIERDLHAAIGNQG